MVVLYHQPSLATIYAQRTIYFGYKNAFEDLGHTFLTLTDDDDLADTLKKHQVDLFMTASHFYWRKSLDLQLLKRYREKGLKVLVKVDFWRYPQAKRSISEPDSLQDDKELVGLIKNGMMGDYFHHVVAPGDWRMEGFKETTSYTCHTIPLAADKIALKPHYRKKFNSDLAFLGTCSPTKKAAFANLLFPLKKQYDLKLYGQDWTAGDRALGWVQRFGQYFNIPVLKTIRKPKLKLEEEAEIYQSAKISLNIHEYQQVKYGGDCNERAFKIPFCGGFQIADNVSCLHNYFVDDKEIIITKDGADWFAKIRYYLDNPQERAAIIAAGQKKVAEHHTYHNRVAQIEKIVFNS